MSAVLTWIRQNVYIVIFLVVMVAAAVAMPIVSSKMNATVKDDVESRARKYGEMESLERTAVSIPGDSSATQNVVVNQNLLEQYRLAVEARQEDADAVFDIAVAHNRKGRGVLLPALFPDPRLDEADVLPKDFYDKLQAAYDLLLDRVGAGVPPDPAEVGVDLKRDEQQYLTNMLAVSAVTELDDEQLEILREHLRETRIGTYKERAAEIGFYCLPETVKRPPWNQAALPSQTELFEWQWTYWMHEDLLEALAAANADSVSVMYAPVKHVIAATVEPPTDFASIGSGGGGGGGGGGMGMGMGGGRGRGGGGGGAGAAPPAQQLNPRTEAKLDYRVSITGRKTNPLYDVRYMNVQMVVDPTRLAQVLDALAARNFITVIDLRMGEVDPYQWLRRGYFYGSDELAMVWLRLETIWLRPWTKQFMPAELRSALGIAPDPEPRQDA